MGRVWRPRGVTPLKDCIQNNSIKIQSWVKSKWSRIQCVSGKKVWKDGVSWTILDDWRYKVCEGWASFWKSSLVGGSNGNLMDWKNENEHPAGVAPPCRPPPAGCSEFPIHALHHRAAPTRFMEGRHMPYINPATITNKIQLPRQILEVPRMLVNHLGNGWKRKGR